LGNFALLSDDYRFVDRGNVVPFHKLSKIGGVIGISFLALGGSIHHQSSNAFAEITLILASAGAQDPDARTGFSGAQANDETQGQTSSQVAKASYRIIGVGDIMMGSDYPEPRMDPRVTPGSDPADVIGAEMKSLFQSGDVVFGNYEGTLHTSNAGAKNCRNPAICFVFRSPPFHAKYLKSAGFTMMSNANNHARDFGEEGRRATFANLRATGMSVSGADDADRRLAIQTLHDGTKVSLVSFGHNPGLPTVQDLNGVRALVSKAQEASDIVVVSCHIGAEGSAHDRVTRSTEMFLGENRGNPFAFARTAVDAGADVVFCHGPHIPRAIEVYNGRFIAYSLGNFWTYGRFNLSGYNGTAPIADLDVAKDGSLIAAQIVSIRQDRPGGPYLDPAGTAARRIADLSKRDIPESGIEIALDGTVSWKQ